MNIEYKIIAARPNNATSDKQFTNAVRAKIIKTQPKYRRLSFTPILRLSPVATMLIIFAAIALLSGTVYAVNYLWPQLAPRASDPQKSSSGRQSVIVTQCDAIDSTKHYELKAGAPVGADSLNDVVMAQCELNAVTKWAEGAYPDNQRPERTNVNAPGAEFEHSTIMPAMFVDKLVKTSEGNLTIADGGSLMERNIRLSPDVKYIVDGKYVASSTLQPGDAISYVSRNITKVRNRDDCTDANCHGDVVSASEAVLAVVKMKYSFDTYRSIKYLTELSVCMGNPSDECPSLGSIDLYERLGGGDNFEMAEIAGEITAYSDQSITITTTSGRQVVVYTPWNLISRFNTDRSAGYGHSIGMGDMLSIWYNQVNGTANDTEIPWERLTWVKLLIEASSKAGPYNKY